MKVQTDIVEPDLVLFTTLSPSHIEGFPSVQAYYEEKGKILSRRKKNTFAIGNRDDIHQISFDCQEWYGSHGVNWMWSDAEESCE